jgi:hypothetical protein
MQLNVSVRVKLDQRAINRLTGPQGPVGKMTQKTAEDVARRAKASAPVKSGRYRDSIRVVGPVQGRTGPVCSVVAGVEYGRSIEFLQKPVLRDATRNARVIV